MLVMYPRAYMSFGNAAGTATDDSRLQLKFRAQLHHCTPLMMSMQDLSTQDRLASVVRAAEMLPTLLIIGDDSAGRSEFVSRLHASSDSKSSTGAPGLTIGMFELQPTVVAARPHVADMPMRPRHSLCRRSERAQTGQQVLHRVRECLWRASGVCSPASRCS